MLFFEKVDLRSFDWHREMEAYPDRTIFQSSDWIQFIARTQHAEPVIAALKDGNAILGYFTGLVVRKFGFRILGSPFPGWTTSYMGLCLSSRPPMRDAVEALLRFAFSDLKCVHFEMLDRKLNLAELDGLGLEHRLVRGFEIDLNQTEEILFSQMSSACRRCIRKAEKTGIYIEEANDLQFADDYYTQLKDVFAKQSKVPPYTVDRVRELLKFVHPTGRLLLLRARDHKGRCIATGIFPAMNQTMYFWGGASWREDQSSRPNELVQWYAMRYWKDRGIRTYDMGGGGEYKRKYGGSEIAVPWFRKSKYYSIAGLRNVARQLVKTRQRLIGSWQNPAGSRA